MHYILECTIETKSFRFQLFPLATFSVLFIYSLFLLLFLQQKATFLLSSLPIPKKIKFVMLFK